MTTKQAPIGSGFNAFSTAKDVIAGIDLTGKVAIVTGGYSGLGRETVRVLRAAGARVIVPARDIARATSALAGIDGVEIRALDLLDPASIDGFARAVTTEIRDLHILVNSAGIMAVPELTLSADGHEIQFATNHLGHFRLTARLWPALKRAGGARVVSVSSRGHRFSPVVFDDIDFKNRPYDPWTAYGQSKTANVLFALELDRRGEADGIRAFAVHPGGIVDTNLAKHLNPERLRAVGAIDAEGRPIIDPAKGFKNVPQGAATQVWCAVSAKLAGLGGVYCEDGDIAPLLDDEVGFSLSASNLSQGGVRPHAVDTEAARRLWTLSEEWTGVRLPA